TPWPRCCRAAEATPQHPFPFPPPAPSGIRSLASSVLWGAPTSSVRPVSLRRRRSSVPRGAGARSYLAEQCHCGLLDARALVSGLPTGTCHEEIRGPPRFLGNPCVRAALFDPDAAATRLALRGAMLPSAGGTASASITDVDFGALSRGPHARCLRF